MKKGKALLALLLAVLMVFSLTGCSKIKDIAGGGGKSTSKGPETLWAAMDEFQDWEGYEAEAKIDVSSDMFTGTITMENGKVVKNGNNVDMQFDMKVSGEAEDLDVDIDDTFIGTFTFLEGVLYIDLSESEVFDVIEEVAGVEVDDDMIENALVNMLGMKEKDVASTRVFSLEIGTVSKKAKGAQDSLTDAFIKMMEKGLDEYTEKDEKEPEWTVSFDQKSAPDVITGLMQAFLDDFDNIWDNMIVLVEESQKMAIVEKLKDMLGDAFDTSVMDDFLDDSDSYADQLADGLEELLDDPTPIEDSFKDIKFTCEYTFGYSGKEGSREMTMEGSMNVKSPEKVNTTMTATYKEAEVKIEEPEDATDLSKVLEAAAGLIGGFTPGPGPVIPPETEAHTYAPATEAPTEAPTEEPTTLEPSTNAPATSEGPQPSGVPTASGPWNGTDLVLIGSEGIGRVYLEDIGNGFTVDQVYYSDNHGFIDLHDANDCFAYIYMYELPEDYSYDPDSYYQTEIVEDILENTGYTNTSADDMSYLYSWAANDYYTDYDVYYATVRYTDEEGTDMVKICSFSNLGYPSDFESSTLAVSVEITDLTVETYDNLMQELGSEYEILNMLYPMIRIEMD